MKLRNKKTGEIKDIQTIIYEAFTVHGVEILKNLEANWEDYKPAEPLIKDEKIRKAVRAWAEANGIDESQYRDVEFDRSEHRLKWIRTVIEFDSIEGLENLENGRKYTIAELCGEEEE